MNLYIALLLCGGVLLALSGPDRAFQRHERSSAKTKRLPRIVAAIAALFFVAASSSLGTASDSRPDKEGFPKQVERVKAKGRRLPSIQFIIFDELQPHHLASEHREEAVVKIDGIAVGTITVNEYFPKSELIVKVANEGEHSFAIESRAIFRIDNTLAEVNCYGSGAIYVTRESRFLFESRYDPRERVCSAWLEGR